MSYQKIIKKYIDHDMANIELARLGQFDIALHMARHPARSHNEDAAAIISVSPRMTILAIADGAGGHYKGEEAAKIAVDELCQRLTKVNDSEEEVRLAILNTFEAANQRILDLKVGAATTFLVAEIIADQIRTYHAGDTFALLQGERGKQKYQTIGHSALELGQEAGLIEDTDTQFDNLRGLITNCLGAAHMRVEMSSSLIMSKKDTLLLASDGLMDNVKQEEMSECILEREIEKACFCLASRAKQAMSEPERHRSKEDDLSIILFRRLS